MEYTHSVDGSNYEVDMRGKFTFSDHEKFRSILDDVKESDAKILVLNFSNVTYIDSAALGMLLIAKEETEKASKDLILKQPVGQTDKIFKLSKFHTLFTIED